MRVRFEHLRVRTNLSTFVANVRGIGTNTDIINNTVNITMVCSTAYMRIVGIWDRKVSWGAPASQTRTGYQTTFYPLLGHTAWSLECFCNIED